MTHYLDHNHGHLANVNELQLYLLSIKEKHVDLYHLLINNLQKLLKAISILRQGKLPVELVSHSKLSNMSREALKMIQRRFPNHVLATELLNSYYSMKLVTFCIDQDHNLILTFENFIQEHGSSLRLSIK